MIDVIVIGCGIIGATVTKALQKQGRTVLTLDSNRPMAGTTPSGGHLKPSWFSGMKKTEYEPAMELLSDTWGMAEEEFTIRPTGLSATVYRVDTDRVASTPRTYGEVTSVDQLHNYPLVVYNGKNGEPTEVRCRLLVVATGAWATELLPQIKVKAKQGVSFRISGKIDRGFIKPWAPYKQVVAHQQSANEIWIGDGSAIIPTNWTEERTRKCMIRCCGALQTKPANVLRTLSGLRPYCDSGSDPCLLQQLGPRAWVATGAGKSGTIAAGWVANKLLNKET